MYYKKVTKLYVKTSQSPNIIKLLNYRFRKSN